MKTTKIITFAIAVAIASVSISGTAMAKKNKLEKKCGSCHALETGKKDKMGPNLVGVIGRQAGTAEGFKKYKAFKGGVGPVWTEALLAEWITDQKKFLKGPNANGAAKKTAMSARIKKEKDRVAIIALLKELK